MSGKRGRNMLMWTIGILISLVGVGYFILRPTLIASSAELPAGFPQKGFSHDAFEKLLEEFVVDGRVDYARWHHTEGAKQRLELYLAAVAQFSPVNTPSRFDKKADEVAYWMYAYNALVIREIVKRWPLASVTDVKAPIEVVKGLGFFYKLKFVAGGEVLSLYEIEHEKVLKNANDPRVHFVLNCGSGSCPIIRPKLPTGDELEPYLARAAAEFVANEANVRIDHERRTISLSKIFHWYKDDFLNDLRRQGQVATGGVLAYVASVAEGEVRVALLAAQDYTPVFEDYDWSVNSAETRHD